MGRLSARKMGDEDDPETGRARPGEIAYHTFLGCERCAAIEDDAIATAESDPFDGEPAQADVVGHAGINRDAIGAAGNQHTGFADPVIYDADRFRDGHRARAAGVEHGDLAAGQRIVMGLLKRAAGIEPVAVIGVIPAGA